MHVYSIIWCSCSWYCPCCTNVVHLSSSVCMENRVTQKPKKKSPTNTPRRSECVYWLCIRYDNTPRNMFYNDKKGCAYPWASGGAHSSRGSYPRSVWCMIVKGRGYVYIYFFLHKKTTSLDKKNTHPSIKGWGQRLWVRVGWFPSNWYINEYIAPVGDLGDKDCCCCHRGWTAAVHTQIHQQACPSASAPPHPNPMVLTLYRSQTSCRIQEISLITLCDSFHTHKQTNIHTNSDPTRGVCVFGATLDRKRKTNGSSGMVDEGTSGEWVVHTHIKRNPTKEKRELLDAQRGIFTVDCLQCVIGVVVQIDILGLVISVSYPVLLFFLFFVCL